MRIDLAYIVEDVDRHGNVRIYFRRRGFPKYRMRDKVGTPEFLVEYDRLKSVTNQITPNQFKRLDDRHKPISGSWRALCVAYFGSAMFRRLHADTQRIRRRVLESTCQEPLHPRSQNTFGQMPVQRFGSKAVKVLRDRKAEYPEAANNRVKAISAAFSCALENEQPGVTSNPARDIARIRTSSTGHHTWTEDEVRQFEERHRIGTKARLAMSLILLTGVRRSDVVRLGRPHLRGQELRFIASKNRNRSPILLEIPVLPELRTILDGSDLGDITFFVTSHGRPFTAAGFGNWFRERCNEAELSHCSAHGLRKAGSTRAAEIGASAHQLMAMFGWKTIGQAQTYTQKAERRRLAHAGMPLIVAHVGTK